MNSRIITKTALFCVTLIGFALPCIASETAAPPENIIQKTQQEEAVVVSIDQNNVTLQSTAEKGKTFTISSKNAADFKVGDRVTVVGNTLKKSETTPNTPVKPLDSSSSSQKPAS